MMKDEKEDDLVNAEKKLSSNAAKKMEDGAVTQGYRGERHRLIGLLNTALASELVCFLRYTRHYYMVSGLSNAALKAEFMQHAQEEMQHANMLAERIVQLNGKPDFDPGDLVNNAHTEYDDTDKIQGMIKANLVAERIAIESYRKMIQELGNSYPSTSLLLTTILSKEEEHAEEMRSLLD